MPPARVGWGWGSDQEMCELWMRFAADDTAAGNGSNNVSTREVRMIGATPTEYTEKGALQVLEGKSWTAPSLAAGRVLVRNLEQAACLSFER